jgi:hypothetical protein
MKTQTRQLKLFFNRAARTSAAQQLIRASWLTPGFATWLGLTKQSCWAFILMMIGWLVLQVSAHVIKSIEEVDPVKPDAAKRKTASLPSEVEKRRLEREIHITRDPL